MPLGKNASSYRGAFRVPFSNYSCLHVCLRERMVSEDSTRTVLLRARRLLMLLLLAADGKERQCAVCGTTFKITCSMERKQKNDLVPTRTQKNPAASKHTHIKKTFFIYGNSLHGPASWTHTKDDTSEVAIVQPVEHQRTFPPGSRVSEYMSISLLRTSAVVFCLASIGE